MSSGTFDGVQPTGGNGNADPVSAKPSSPHFRRPPLVEFAISIQFEPLTKFSFAEIGPLRDHFRDPFLRIEYHPQAPPTFEMFGPSPSIPQPQFSFALPVTVPRVWLIDEDGAQLLQFQPDRLVRNWRRTQGTDSYPRYASMKSDFIKDIQSLSTFCDRLQLGEIRPTQCELTYVNQIPSPRGAAVQSAQTFRNRRDIEPAALGKAEEVSIQEKYVIRDDQGSPIGRVYFQSGPGLETSESSNLMLMVVGRGPPKVATLDSAAEYLDLLHDRIVRSFVELTTDSIQAEWEIET